MATPPTQEQDSGIPDVGQEKSNEEIPQLIICVEEPEIYQHPVRARNFARVLSDLAGSKTAQVLVATHSPYFVRPDQFDCLRRMTLREGRAVMTHMSVSQVATKSGISEANVNKAAIKEFPRALAEGFFSDAVILVEGDTDKIVIEAIAEILSRPLDAAGVTVVALGGKTNLRTPCALLDGLGVRSYILCDGDYGTAEKKYGLSDDKREKRENAHTSHAQATNDLLSWITPPSEEPHLGIWPYCFGDDSLVSDTFAIWRDDLEGELRQWGSFVAAMNLAHSQLDGKDALAYRTGVMEARSDDIPVSLRELIDSVHRMLT